MKHTPVLYVVAALVLSMCACEPATPEPWTTGDVELVVDDPGTGTIVWQVVHDDLTNSDMVVCEAKGMTLTLAGKALARWTMHLDPRTGEPCCEATLPCCGKPACPCAVTALMKAKGVLQQ